MKQTVAPQLEAGAGDDHLRPKSAAASVIGFWNERRATFPGLLALTAIALLDTLLSGVWQFTSFVAKVSSSPANTYSIPLEVGIVQLALIPPVIAWLLGKGWLMRGAFILQLAISFLSIVAYLVLSVVEIPHRSGNTGATVLLVNALVLWVVNLCTFAILYWILDGGGPNRRGTPSSGRLDFRFVQWEIPERGYEGWSPKFNDYLHLAFLISVSFNPGNMDVLSHRGKNITMLQALVSLVIIFLLVARAVSLFGGS